jgi:hypothetical protein
MATDTAQPQQLQRSSYIVQRARGARRRRRPRRAAAAAAAHTRLIYRRGHLDGMRN